jgi:hypothetical protein
MEKLMVTLSFKKDIYNGIPKYSLHLHHITLTFYLYEGNHGTKKN